MIWVALASLALVVVAALLWPLIRQDHAGEADSPDIVVLHDQLAEIERDRARGTLTSDEADAIKIEIQRRLLAAGRRRTVATWREGPGPRAALTAAVAVIVPMLAFAIYMNIGAPTLRPAAAAPPTDPEMGRLVEQLAARMQADPTNIEGWTLLARSYRQIERYADALEAYRHVLSLNPPDAEPYANFGEMALTINGGRVDDQAQAAFQAALERDRSEPRSRFYLGLAAAQNGDPQSAIAIWRDLTAGAPPDASWLEMVRTQMFQVAQSAAIMPMQVAPRHPLDVPSAMAAVMTPSGPTAPQPADPNDVTAPDVSAIQGQFSGENLAQIQAMVGSLAGRLENMPEDYNGWLMLGRSYMVLRNTAGAARAFERAMALRPNDVAPKLNYIAVLMGETDLNGPTPLPDAVLKTNAEILKLSADQPEALFVRGLSAFKRGDAAAARKDWTAAKARATGPLAADLDRRLNAMK
jgi:cytochrome c-type biogenesis protein CcmH